MHVLRLALSQLSNDWTIVEGGYAKAPLTCLAAVSLEPGTEDWRFAADGRPKPEHIAFCLAR